MAVPARHFARVRQNARKRNGGQPMLALISALVRDPGGENRFLGVLDAVAVDNAVRFIYNTKKVSAVNLILKIDRNRP